MNGRKRAILTGIWLAVAALMAITVENPVPESGIDVARVLVVLVALFLAGVYLFDPYGVATGGPFEDVEGDAETE